MLHLLLNSAKATDENLTSENWEYILDVCDRVSSSDSGSKDVVAAMIKRLAHRNANVQLYTLELANALSQNCGIPMHRELASRSFTDALLRLTGDRVSKDHKRSGGALGRTLLTKVQYRTHISRSSPRYLSEWRSGQRCSPIILNSGSWSRRS